MAEFIVLGAGMVGISSALALQEVGHTVTVVDRIQPGLESSFGNAGIIQTEAVEPYALPQDISTLWRYAIGQTNDVLWKLEPTLRMAPALWRYFLNSATDKHRKISITYAKLAALATADHAPLIEASGSEELIIRNGLAMLYRDEASFEKEKARAERLEREFCVRSRIVDGVTYQAEEPALKQAPAGAIHWLDSWSCKDPGGLTQAYAALFEQRGGRILHGDASSLTQTTTGWVVKTEQGIVGAEQVVIALGPWSPELLKRFGYRIPMVYKRGYHGHYQETTHLNRPFLDVANGVLAAPMSRGIRVTTGAALVDLNDPADPEQLERGVNALRSLLEMGERVQEKQWYGTRPCMPDMLPVVGKAPKHDRMWFHFGHGHQGFTQGPTTAKILMADIAGERESQWLPLEPSARF
ncbi:NAD(P)/FAD-dependent oxidoreductase [Marinomonas communis]|uniref:Glycine/D-amino acid oxidase-like deaminating enzyme n=1 Tax=Marinomonas communis TaxID=28254 RepID=A0A4R6X1V4_9GAMM|nr:FAD-binding oxidoreductase [Marinomonas communis]TDR06398.1 glycine/D-amino acid oxidase-like deaminating enzyme [Marinomonas communis]